MPIYDFKCNSCGIQKEISMSVKEYEDYLEKGGQMWCLCGGGAERVFTSSQAIRVFKPDWYEHIASEPIYVESREQLKKECAKHGCKSKYIEDSYNR